MLPGSLSCGIDPRKSYKCPFCTYKEPRGSGGYDDGDVR
jgi:hypothetical protein